MQLNSIAQDPPRVPWICNAGKAAVTPGRPFTVQNFPYKNVQKTQRQVRKKERKKNTLKHIR